SVQQELRAPPRAAVRAEPSRRGLRRDLCRLADAGERVAEALRRLAGAAQVALRRGSDERDRASRALAAHAPQDRSAPPPAQNTARPLRAEARALRRR